MVLVNNLDTNLSTSHKEDQIVPPNHKARLKGMILLGVRTETLGGDNWATNSWHPKYH